MRTPALLRRSRSDDDPEQDPTPRRRTIALAVSGACAFAIVAGLVWITITGLLARSQLTDVKTELPQLRSALTSGDFATARTISAELATHAARAHRLTTGPAWWVTANLPIAGSPLLTVRIIAAQTDRVGQQVLPGVLRLADNLKSGSLRHGSSIDLGPIAAAAPVLASSAAAADSAVLALAAAPRSTWLPYVDSARTTVAHSLDTLTAELDGANRTVQTLLPMLGGSGLQRYFIGFENEAESRGLGGLPGAFAIVTADHGTIRFTHFGNDSELDGVRVNLNLGPQFAARYGVDDPTGLFINSDISPHFPDAARIWAAMWQQKSGEHMDGAIAVDPTALSYLLAVTGPATMPDGSSVGADNIVALTQKDGYARFSNIVQRKAYFVAVARAVSTRLTTSSGSTTSLIRAVARAAGERRLVAWSANPRTEANIAAAGYGGLVQGGAGPFSGFVVVNAAGSKLDYYLARSMTYHRTGCGAGSTAVASVTLSNDAPASGLPPYVTTRADNAPSGVKPGDNRLLVTYYASQGATITSVTVDGKPVTVVAAPENGLVTVSLDLELPVGRSRTMTVTLREPPANRAMTILDQPLVRPMHITVTGDTCG